MPKKSELTGFPAGCGVGSWGGHYCLPFKNKDRKLVLVFPTPLSSLQNFKGLILDRSHWSQSYMKLFQYSFSEGCQESGMEGISIKRQFWKRSYCLALFSVATKLSSKPLKELVCKLFRWSLTHRQPLPWMLWTAVLCTLSLKPRTTPQQQWWLPLLLNCF